MGRWVAGVLLIGLLAACTPAGAAPTASPPGAPPATTAAAPSPTPSAEPSTPACDFLPEGVDERACGTPVATAEPIPASGEFPDLYVLTAGDGRIRCDLSGAREYAACAVRAELTPVVPEQDCDAGDWDNNFVYLWKPSDGTYLAGQGSCRSDPLTSEQGEPPILPEGSILVDGDLAALATPDGIVVWSGVAGHGFAVAGDRVQTW